MDDYEELLRKQNHRKIVKAGDRKILRKQMELLAEYSRLPYAHEKIPEASAALLDIYRELIKTKYLFVTVFPLLFCAFLNLGYSVTVKHVKLFKRE